MVDPNRSPSDAISGGATESAARWRRFPYLSAVGVSGKPYRSIFIFLNQLSTSFCASSALAPLITRYCPSLSTPPRVTKPSRTVLCGQSSLTV